MIKKNIFLIFLSSIPSLFICLFVYNNISIIDVSVYDDKFILAANQILLNGTYSDNYYLPLYPYLLAFIFKIFGTNLFYPILLNSIFHGISVFLIAKIAERFNKKWFYLSLILGAIWPHLIWRTTYVYAETFFILLVVTSLYFLFSFIDKKRIFYLLISSFFLGLSLITKSSNIFVLFLLPFFLIYFFNNQITKSYFLSIKLVASYLLVLFIVLSFQFLRIYKETGYLGYNYQSGNALLSYVYPCLSTKFGCGKKNLDSMKKGMELYDNELKISDSTDSENRFYQNIVRKKIAIDLLKELDFKQSTISAIGGYTKLFFHNFTYDLFERFKITTIHLTDFTGNFLIKTKKMLYEIFQNKEIMFIWIISQFFLFFSRFIQILGFYSFLKSKDKIYDFLLLLVFFIPCIFPVLGQGTIRYRAPLEPLLIIFTISGIFFLYHSIRKKLSN